MLPMVSARILRAILLLLLLSLFTFVLSRKMPGDIWITLQMDPSVSPATLRQLRTEYGLDKPLLVQYLSWLRLVSRGNLGYSPVEKTAVAPLLRERLGRTLILASVTLLLTVLASLLLSLSILYPKWDPRWLDSLLIPLLLAAPTTLTCLAFNWLRIQTHLSSAYYGTAGISTQLTLVIWPALALSVPLTAYLARQMRREVSQILGHQYVITAESKGLKLRYLYRQILKPTAPIFLNLIGLLFSSLIAGAVVAETVFDFPGIGLLTWDATSNRDTFLLVGAVLSACSLVILVNLAVDLLAIWFDPRLRTRAL